jgi:hypothetical protein
LGGDLGEFRRTDIEALGQALDWPDQIFGQNHPADAPAGHAKYFENELMMTALSDTDNAVVSSPLQVSPW